MKRTKTLTFHYKMLIGKVCTENQKCLFEGERTPWDKLGEKEVDQTDVSLHIQICGTVSSGGAWLLLVLYIKQITLSFSGDSGQNSIFRVTQMLEGLVWMFFLELLNTSILQNLSGFCCISAYLYSALNLTEGDSSLGFCCIAIILVSEAWGLLCCGGWLPVFQNEDRENSGTLKEAKKYWQPFLGQKLETGPLAFQKHWLHVRWEHLFI